MVPGGSSVVGYRYNPSHCTISSNPIPSVMGCRNNPSHCTIISNPTPTPPQTQQTNKKQFSPQPTQTLALLSFPSEYAIAATVACECNEATAAVNSAVLSSSGVPSRITTTTRCAYTRAVVSIIFFASINPPAAYVAPAEVVLLIASSIASISEEKSKSRRYPLTVVAWLQGVNG